MYIHTYINHHYFLNILVQIIVYNCFEKELDFSLHSKLKLNCYKTDIGVVLENIAKR